MSVKNINFLFSVVRPILPGSLPTLLLLAGILPLASFNASTALAGGGSVCVLETANPNLQVVSLAVSPPVVSARSRAKGEVKLSAPAPKGGVTVILSTTFFAANPGYCVVVPEGKTSQSFDVTTFDQSTTTSGSIIAGYGDSYLTVPLTVTP